MCKDNTTVSFIHCLRRHIYCYRAPSSILSDNTNNFTSCNKILEDHSEHEAVKYILRTKNIKWSFTPSYSPWAGAVYESIIKIVKKVLRKTFNSRRMSLEDMITLTYHAEFVANSRPISYVTQQDNDLILTPNLLLYGRNVCIENWLDNDTHKDPDYTLITQSDLGNNFRALRNAMKSIEQTFNSCYFDMLKTRDAKQMVSKNCRKRNLIDKIPQVGDVILLADDKGRLGQISRIVEVSKNNGEPIRSCKVILNREAKWWPLNKISFFEVASPNTLPSKFQTAAKTTGKNMVFPRKKLSRLAKQNVNYNQDESLQTNYE